MLHEDILQAHFQIIFAARHKVRELFVTELLQNFTQLFHEWVNDDIERG
jgi:hypothetical protein